MFQPLQDALTTFLNYLPQLIGAIIILIVLGAVALAAAIAFGLGSREVARDIVEKAYDRRNEAQGGTDRGTSTQNTSAGGREGETGPTAHRPDRNE